MNRTTTGFASLDIARMSIKFTCPHCTKTLKVADDLAGKKGKCPSCLKPVVIPKPGSNAPVKASLKAPTKGPLAKAGNGQVAKPAPKKKPAVDVDALAMEALADPKAEEVVATMFKFKCDFCEEEVEVNTELCGKQAPCPGCRRIIKIPLQKKAEAKDWRKVDQRPSGARLDLEVPDGAWGSTSLGRVSVDSLEEAGVIKEQKIPLTPRQKVSRGLTLFAVATVSIVGLWWMWGFWAQSSFERSRHDAESFLPHATPDPNRTQIKGPAAAEVYRVLGLMQSRNHDAVKANKRYSEARRELQFLSAASEEFSEQDRDGLFVVITLARDQIELGADKPFESRHLTWPDAQKYVQQTLGLLGSEQPQGLRGDSFKDARGDAVDEVGTAFLKIKPDFAASILGPLGSSPSDPELAAMFGLLLVRQGEQTKAAEWADQLLKDYQKIEKHKPPPSPYLVALLLAVKKDADAAGLIPPPTPGDRFVKAPARLAYSLGWAYQENWANAFDMATTMGDDLDRFTAILAITKLASKKLEGDLPKYVEEALTAFAAAKATSPITSWKQRDLVRLALKAKISEDKIKTITDPWAQLELVRARMVEGKPSEEAWADVIEDKNSLPYGLALEMIAAERAKQGSNLHSKISGWKPQWVQPLGYAGTALGLQVPSE